MKNFIHKLINQSLRKILGVFFVIIFIIGNSQAQIIPRFAAKNIILLGSIQFNQSVDREIEFPILYKGKEYVAKVETHGDTRKAHFELYEEEKPTEIFILITDYLALPDNPMIMHLYTSPYHSFKFFKLTRTQLDTNSNKETYDTWQIEEIVSSKESIIIPDNTIIVFLSPDIVEKIQPLPWLSQSNIINFPIIKLKETISKNILYEIADKMKLTLLDFKFLHKKANLASIPYTNNRLLSMPFTSRRSQV